MRTSYPQDDYRYRHHRRYPSIFSWRGVSTHNPRSFEAHGGFFGSHPIRQSARTRIYTRRDVTSGMHHGFGQSRGWSANPRGCHPDTAAPFLMPATRIKGTFGDGLREKDFRLLQDFEDRHDTLRKVLHSKEKRKGERCFYPATNIQCGAHLPKEHLCEMRQTYVHELTHPCKLPAVGVLCGAYENDGVHCCAQYAPTERNHPWNAGDVRNCGICGRIHVTFVTCFDALEGEPSKYRSWARRHISKPYLPITPPQRRQGLLDLQRKQERGSTGSTSRGIQIGYPGIPPRRPLPKTPAEKEANPPPPIIHRRLRRAGSADRVRLLKKALEQARRRNHEKASKALSASDSSSAEGSDPEDHVYEEIPANLEEETSRKEWDKEQTLLRNVLTELDLGSEQSNTESKTLEGISTGDEKDMNPSTGKRKMGNDEDTLMEVQPPAKKAASSEEEDLEEDELAGRQDCDPMPSTSSEGYEPAAEEINSTIMSTDGAADGKDLTIDGECMMTEPDIENVDHEEVVYTDPTKQKRTKKTEKYRSLTEEINAHSDAEETFDAPCLNREGHLIARTNLACCRILPDLDPEDKEANYLDSMKPDTVAEFLFEIFQYEIDLEKDVTGEKFLLPNRWKPPGSRNKEIYDIDLGGIQCPGGKKKGENCRAFKLNEFLWCIHGYTNSTNFQPKLTHVYHDTAIRNWTMIKYYSYGEPMTELNMGPVKLCPLSNALDDSCRVVACGGYLWCNHGYTDNAAVVWRRMGLLAQTVLDNLSRPDWARKTAPLIAAYSRYRAKYKEIRNQLDQRYPEDGNKDTEESDAESMDTQTTTLTASETSPEKGAASELPPANQTTEGTDTQGDAVNDSESHERINKNDSGYETDEYESPIANEENEPREQDGNEGNNDEEDQGMDIPESYENLREVCSQNLPHLKFEPEIMLTGEFNLNGEEEASVGIPLNRLLTQEDIKKVGYCCPYSMMTREECKVATVAGYHWCLHGYTNEPTVVAKTQERLRIEPASTPEWNTYPVPLRGEYFPYHERYDMLYPLKFLDKIRPRELKCSGTDERRGTEPFLIKLRKEGIFNYESCTMDGRMCPISRIQKSACRLAYYGGSIWCHHGFTNDPTYQRGLRHRIVKVIPSMFTIEEYLKTKADDIRPSTIRNACVVGFVTGNPCQVRYMGLHSVCQHGYSTRNPGYTSLRGNLEPETEDFLKSEEKHEPRRNINCAGHSCHNIKGDVAEPYSLRLPGKYWFEPVTDMPNQKPRDYRYSAPSSKMMDQIPGHYYYSGPHLMRGGESSRAIKKPECPTGFTLGEPCKVINVGRWRWCNHGYTDCPQYTYHPERSKDAGDLHQLEPSMPSWTKYPVILKGRFIPKRIMFTKNKLPANKLEDLKEFRQYVHPSMIPLCPVARIEQGECKVYKGPGEDGYLYCNHGYTNDPRFEPLLKHQMTKDLTNMSVSTVYDAYGITGPHHYVELPGMCVVSEFTGVKCKVTNCGNIVFCNHGYGNKEPQNSSEPWMGLMKKMVPMSVSGQRWYGPYSEYHAEYKQDIRCSIITNEKDEQIEEKVRCKEGGCSWSDDVHCHNCPKVKTRVEIWKLARKQTDIEVVNPSQNQNKEEENKQENNPTEEVQPKQKKKPTLQERRRPLKKIRIKISSTGCVVCPGESDEEGTLV